MDSEIYAVSTDTEGMGRLPTWLLWILSPDTASIFPGFRIMWDAMGILRPFWIRRAIFSMRTRWRPPLCLLWMRAWWTPVIRKPKVEMYKKERPMDVRAGLSPSCLLRRVQRQASWETAMLPPGKGEQLGGSGQPSGPGAVRPGSVAVTGRPRKVGNGRQKGTGYAINI